MKAIAALIVLILIGGGYYFFEHSTRHDVTFTVKSLDDQATRNGHKYMVFTTDGTAYENVDAAMSGKHDSSNIQAWLTPGHTYTCPVYGVRNELASSYPNILDGCTDVTAGVPAAQRTP